jgi:molecular chaperone GrpE
MSNTNEANHEEELPQQGDASTMHVADTPESSEPDSSQPDDNATDLAAQLEEANANYLRAKAEVENVLKRTRREIEDERRYAAMSIMRDLLTVVDNVHRAIEAAQNDENSSGLLEGVKMVATQLDGVLDQHGCKQIKALAEPFNPNLHEAIGQEPSDEIPAKHVSRDLRVGYQLHERVVRPSQVFVSTGPADDNSGQ